MWRALLVVGLLGGNALAQPSEEPEAAPVDDPSVRDYQKCVKARADAMRDAEKMLDPDDRKDAYTEIPRCEPPASRAMLGMRRPWEPTTDEMKTLGKGEFSGGEIAGLVTVNLLIGAGVGQGIEGRWTKTGWIFWLGESASMGLMIAGFARDMNALGHSLDGLCLDFSGNGANCPDTPPRHYPSGRPLEIAGLIGLLAFRSASIADVIYGAHVHNDRVRTLRRKAGIVPTLVPQAGGATAGVNVRF